MKLVKLKFNIRQQLVVAQLLPGECLGNHILPCHSALLDLFSLGVPGKAIMVDDQDNSDLTF